MIKYKCEHETDGVIILDENLLSMTAYIQWAEEENNLETKQECFDCYLKKLNHKRIKMCKSKFQKEIEKDQKRLNKVYDKLLELGDSWSWQP